MPIEMLKTIPILRIFSVEKAREFYVDYLGFQVDWEHRFEDVAPIYMQVSRGKPDPAPVRALRRLLPGIDRVRLDDQHRRVSSGARRQELQVFAAGDRGDVLRLQVRGGDRSGRQPDPLQRGAAGRGAPGVRLRLRDRRPAGRPRWPSPARDARRGRARGSARETRRARG